MKRRDFLAGTAFGVGAVTLAKAPLAAAAQATQATAAKKVLVLGGRNYVGPHLAWAALEAGHEVTLFNRGFTNPHMFPHLEHLRGNRYPQRGAGLASLGKRREWDLVLDTWQAAPACVDDSARLLADRAARYIYISSIAVFGGYRKAGLNENSATVDGAAHRRSYDAELAYPERKRAAELAVLEHFGDRGTILRCSSVQGYNPSASILPYWGLRFISGEPVLVPDDKTAVVQWTDVRDVGRFALHADTHGLGGIFQLLNTPEPVPLAQLLDAWHAATGRRSRVVPAPREFLAQHSVEPWVHLPLYIPDDDPEPGFFRIDGARAHQTGFRFRPLGETIADVMRTFPAPPAPEVVSQGLKREKELELIWELLG